MRFLSSLLSVLLMAGICMAEAKPAWSADERQIAEKQIFDQLNQERQGAGLPALEWSEQAAQAARNHAQAMVENGQLSHQFPGERSLAERIGATGARFTLAAENIARTGYVEDVHPALMNSRGHRANILSSAYNAVGIGVMEHQNKIYVAQDFLFLVPMYSEEQFGAVFAQAFHLARKSKGRKALDARSDVLLHDLACATEGDAAKLTDKVSDAVAVVVFNSSDPHRLPEEMLGRAANPDFHRMNFGVCFRPDQEHGYANFWVVAAFAN
ncbi:MAG: CAP domain-containing protein [Acidobacteriia bacterium]|nr:CAP domain-containing protein [Terriglobia bacterium]